MSEFPTEVFAEAFYWQISEMVFLDEVDLKAFCLELKNSFDSRDSRKPFKIVKSFLEDKRWNWPNFESSYPNEKDQRKCMEYVSRRIMVKAYSMIHKIKNIDGSAFAPYWMIDSVKDDRTSDYCRSFDGTIKKFSDPFWDDHYPPHQNVDCRCSIMALDENDFQKMANRNQQPERITSESSPKNPVTRTPAWKEACKTFVDNMLQYEKQNNSVQP